MNTELVNLNLSELQQIIYKKISLVEQQEMIQRRNQVLKFDVKAPKYLLEPEIKRFFDYVDNYNDLMLFKTLWITGCRITEVLMLTPAHFNFGIDSCLLSSPNLKQKIRVKKGIYTNVGTKEIILTRDKTKNAYVADYVDELSRYIVTNKIKVNDIIFKYLRQNVNRIIKRVQKRALKDGVEFPFQISTKTFRHSCAMNLYYHGIDEKIIQKYLGHARIENTRVYTELFSLEHDLSSVKF